MKYTEVVIYPASGGFGQWDVSYGDDSWDDEYDLLDAMRDGQPELVELTDAADLPDGLDDIRGSIHNQPSRVFGWLDEDNHAPYVGIHAIDPMDKKTRLAYTSVERMRRSPAKKIQKMNSPK